MKRVKKRMAAAARYVRHPNQESHPATDNHPLQQKNTFQSSMHSPFIDVSLQSKVNLRGDF